jgi:iron complex outermembrane receptor protein
VSNFKKSAALSLSALLISSALTPAFAQESDEVIVTAQKREQSLQDVPLSVEVLSDEKLDVLSSGGEDILFLNARVPSLYAETSFGRAFPRFYIRGLGNTDFDLNANQPVSLVYDEVVLENPILKGFPVFDLDRVEVLRGPQGTLFGRNTPAGVIKFESAKPTEELEGYGRLAYGRFDTFDAEGAVSGPLVEDHLSARLSVLYQSRDDYIDNTAPNPNEDAFEEFEEFAARLQFLLTPTDNVTMLLNIHGRTLDGGSRVFRANVIEQGEGGFVDTFDRFTAAQDAVQNLNVDNLGASFKVDFETDNGVFTSVTSYETVSIDARGDVDGGFGAVFAPPSGPGFIPFDAESADNITGHGQYTQELRYNFDVSETFNTTVGAFAFYEDLELENISYSTLGGSVLNGLAVQDQETTALALFASSEWQATPELTVSGGIRLSYENKDFVASRLIGPFGSGEIGPITRELSDTVLTGDLSVAYAVNEDVNVYGRYSRGFRAPNVQGRLVFGDVVTVADTETIDSFETGVKTKFLDGRGTFNVTGFYFETSDQQLTAVGGGGNFNQLLNAESVVGYGVEVDASLNPFEGMDLTAGFSLNDTEIQDEDLEVGICGANCTVLDPINADTGNALINGNPLPQAPRFIANATARYGIPVSDTGEVFVYGDIAHRSKVNFFLYESVEFTSDNLTEVGLRAGYVHNGGEFEIAGFARNIFNETALEGAVDFNNLTGFINEPTIYGAEITKRF